MNHLSDGLVLLDATAPKVRNSDVMYEYRQDSYFLYLTGIEGEDYTLLIDPKAKKSHLFIPDFNLMHQIWEGRQLTKAQAKKTYGVDHVHYKSDLTKVFNQLKRKYKTVYTLPGLDRSVKAVNANLKKATSPLRIQLDDLRVVKNKEEISFLKKANQVSHKAHVAAMKATKPGLFEYQVQSVYEQTCLAEGARLQAYLPIFGGGANAAILHYKENNMKLKSGDLLLVDAGCEWQGYASDITRTYPINGKFGKKQAEIYDLVLAAQNSCIRRAKPGTSMIELNRHSQEVMAQGLADLGIFKTDDVDEIIDSKAIRIFYPHGLGHLLGIDVHDVGGRPNKKQKLRNTRTFEPGMVFTIEPGLYFIEAHFNNAKTRKKYAKLIDWKKAESYYKVGGVRIEDNIVITKTGNLNLTTVPKTRSAIEKTMR